MSSNQVQFSVTRADFAFDFAGQLEEIFNFAPFDSETPTSADGVRYSENFGYDFQRECSPILRIKALSDELIKSIGIRTEELQINIQIEDPNLRIRKSAFCIPVVEVNEARKVSLDLKAYEELSFLRGFEVKCFISRLNTSSDESLAIWHKSHIVYQKTFIVKAAVDEALFELTWVDFQDEKDKQDLLYFVEWKSSEVTTAIDTDCFQVKANARLKDQIKRLENNNHFGAFSIRMMAEQILSELLQQTLKYANISDSVEPEIDSLHQKFKQLLNKLEIDFNELGRMMQSTNTIERLQACSEVRKIMQKMNKVGSTLDKIRFGGYR